MKMKIVMEREINIQSVRSKMEKRLTCRREPKAYIKIQMYKSRTKEKERKEGRKKN
jgi:hypothetical protein